MDWKRANICSLLDEAHTPTVYLSCEVLSYNKESLRPWPGVQPPVGFWDPAGFTADGDAKDFYRRRVVEIKHGRVSMPLGRTRSMSLHSATCCLLKPLEIASNAKQLLTAARDQHQVHPDCVLFPCAGHQNVGSVGS